MSRWIFTPPCLPAAAAPYKSAELNEFGFFAAEMGPRWLSSSESSNQCHANLPALPPLPNHLTPLPGNRSQIKRGLCQQRPPLDASKWAFPFSRWPCQLKASPLVFVAARKCLASAAAAAGVYYVVPRMDAGPPDSSPRLPARPL